MHLLYIDESGGDDLNARDQHFVLAGISAFERKPYYLSADVETIQQKFFPGVTDPIEFRASAIWNGNGAPWDSMPRHKRIELMREVYTLLSNQRNVVGVSLFGVVLHKPHNRTGAHIQKTCEEMAGHFDAYLGSLELESQDKQRGLMIFDQSRHEKTVQALMTQYRTTGASFGRVKRLAEVPLFTDSKITRMLQLADFIAYALYRRYESSDAQFFDMILPTFHEGSGILHGLVHLNSDFRTCFCPGCLSRRGAVGSS
jgi:hypothetical protein